MVFFQKTLYGQPHAIIFNLSSNYFEYDSGEIALAPYILVVIH